MDSLVLGLMIFFLLMNGGAFFLMALDKRRSRKNGAERISEGMLFCFATAFGSVGVWFGMFAFRHKTQKWYFLLGIPLLILENISLLGVIWWWFRL